MLNNVTFDDLQQAAYQDNEKAFFELDLNNESDVLQWLNREFGRLCEQDWQRMEIVRNNYLRYRGIQYQQQVYTPRDVLETQKTYQPQIVVPFVRDAVDEKVSRLLEYKPSVFPMPTHDETKDKNDAQVAKRFLSHIDYTKDTDSAFRKWVRNSKVAGEAFLWITWDPDAGDPLPAMTKLAPNPDSTQPNGDGKPFIQEAVMQGDVCIKNKTPFFLKRPNAEWKDTDYCFIIEWEMTAKLKAEYPEKAGDINSESKEPMFDFNTMTEKVVTNQARKIYFYHKKTKYLPEGYEAIFVPSALLKKGALSYDHGQLPVVPLLDSENPDEYKGTSFVEYIRALAAAMNNFINLSVKSMMLTGAPKWFVQAGSIDEQQLNNDVSIVKVKQGFSQPTLAQANPVSTQLPQWLQTFKDMFYQMAKSNTISRGDLPQGVTAAVALQFVSESENRRSSEETKKVTEAIRKAYDLILKTCGQFYRPEDQRTMQIMGKDGRFALTDYDVSAIAKPYNLILQNTSALPESKALRTQFIMDMSNARPGLFPDEQVIEMLGFGQTEKFMDLASAAARAAEDEDEMMLGGKRIEPAEHEEHITHWRVHTMAIQAVGYKTKTPPEIQQLCRDHILATEFLMSQQAKASPQYLAKLLMLPNFPLFYKDPQISQMLAMASGMMAQAKASMPEQQPLPQMPQTQASEVVSTETAVQ